MLHFDINKSHVDIILLQKYAIILFLCILNSIFIQENEWDWTASKAY